MIVMESYRHINPAMQSAYSIICIVVLDTRPLSCCPERCNMLTHELGVSVWQGLKSNANSVKHAPHGL